MKRTVIVVVALAAVFASVLTTLAQSGGSYTLTWFAFDGGGGNSSGASYALGGTIGQPDAGQMSGGSYALGGGYWVASLATSSSNTATPTHTPTRTNTPPITHTPTKTSTGNTATFTATPTRTNTPTITHTPTKTSQGGNSPTATPTVTITPSGTPGSGCQTKPDKPTLNSPANNATVTKTRPTLKWNAAQCAETYKVTIKDANTGNTVDKQGGLTVLEYKTDTLAKGKKYKWFVKACNAAFGCDKSAAWFFTVQ